MLALYPGSVAANFLSIRQESLGLGHKVAGKKSTGSVIFA